MALAGSVDLVPGQLVVERETALRLAAQPPAPGRQGDRRRRGRQSRGLPARVVDRDAQRLRHVQRGLVVHVLVQQRQAVEVQRRRRRHARHRASSASVASSWRCSSSRVCCASGSGSDQRVSCATRLEWYSASASGRSGRPRGASGSADAPWPRRGFRASQNSWNQPMWPSSHNGGFSSSRCGTRRPGRACSYSAKVASVSRRLCLQRHGQGIGVSLSGESGRRR